MKKILLIALLISQTQKPKAQEYIIESFQSEYEELENYNSLQLETLGDCCYNEYQFGFDFPYFDRSYTSIEGDETAIYSFFDNIFAVRLLGFIYDWDSVSNPANIQSDIKYVNTTLNNKKVLIIQYTKMRLASDTSIEEYDSNINFQHRFWEDGTIEIVFGDMNLDNSPNYIPNDGLFLMVNGDSLVNLGPELGLVAPEEEFYIGGEGPFDNLEQTDFLGRLLKLAPKGWIIRFTRKLTNSLEQYPEKTKRIIAMPNPVIDNLQFVYDKQNKIQSLSIFDCFGSMLYHSDERLINRIDVSLLSEGIYFWLIEWQDSSISSGKFVK
ncbi:MAG: T9SS type A sorting domain-containing protein [Saprospiraceae bacterium]|nr:T9SS type A sorting domain-containing protein [Saprospiraceae bacterium]